MMVTTNISVIQNITATLIIRNTTEINYITNVSNATLGINDTLNEAGTQRNTIWWLNVIIR